MEKIRVAYIGDSPFLHTGFGNVANGIMSRWDMDRFEVHVLGTMHHYIPRDTAPYETYEPVPHNDPMGFRASVTFIQRVNPDVLFLIGDPGTLRNRFEGIKFAGMGKLMPTVTYFPIEGIPLNPHIIEQARFVVGPVTYTNWGAGVLREKGIEVGVAPHGLDHADFRQYSREDKERLKAIVGWEGKTVIGMVGVNKRTNRQPSLIETARVIKDSGVENFVMYLHCQMRGEGFMGGWELDWMPKEFGVEDHIAFKPGQGEDRYFGRPNKAEVDVFSLPLPADKKEAEANLEKLGYIDILNLFDIYIDPAGAHGWNLPACFIPGTPVETVNGMVSIETVKPGDSVLSHDGFFHSVVSVSETPYSGYATSIKTMGIGEVTCTPEHPFLCVKRSGNDRRGRLGAMKSDAEWVIASEIEVGDYLCVPKSSIRSEMPGRGIEYTLSVTGRQALGFEKILGFGYVNDGRTGQAFWEDDDFVYTPVRSVEMVPYSGFVYNMEVEGSHSYTANRLAVHNCEAARCGVPIIMVDDGFARHEIFSDVVHMLAPTASEYWHTGAVLPLVSPKKMADAIMKMIDSEDMRRVYGAAGKAKFDKFKWQPTADYFAEKVVAADKFGAEMMAKLANRKVGKDVQDVEG